MRMSVDQLARRMFWRKTVSTWCNIAGVECDVAVEADYHGDDEGWGTVEVTSVWYEADGNRLDEMTPEEVTDLEGRLLEKLQDYCDWYYSEAG